jgi:hypothetical protein
VRVDRPLHHPRSGADCAGQSMPPGSASVCHRAGRGGAEDSRNAASNPTLPASVPRIHDADEGSSPAPDIPRGGGDGQCVESSFDAIVHGWLVKFVEHRIADRRVVRLIQKWLNAGVEDGTRTWSEEGAPQGGSASPLLANDYLHYAVRPLSPRPIEPTEF